mgnify:CR=1 FL=1
MSMQIPTKPGYRERSFMLPSDVVTVLDELLQSIPQQRQAAAAHELERRIIMAILGFHRDEGLRNLGVPQSVLTPLNLTLVP